MVALLLGWRVRPLSGQLGNENDAGVSALCLYRPRWEGDMRRLFAGTLLVICGAILLAPTTRAGADQLITFDDINAGTTGDVYPISSPYAGLTWNNFGVVSPATFRAPTRTECSEREGSSMSDRLGAACEALSYPFCLRSLSLPA
jgi:hypothetical protein